MAPLIPDRVARRLVKAGKRPMDAARSPKAESVPSMPVEQRDFSSLDGHKHVLLVTYKRDGGAVPTPVWFARDGDRVYVWTEINAFKAKRLGRDSRALLAPCTPTGAPLGPPIAARGRVLTGTAERERAARTIRRSWGLGRRAFELLSRPLTDVHYIELVPATAPPTGSPGGDDTTQAT